MKKSKGTENINEEFSVEFGDVNGMKLDEIAYSPPKDQKKSKHKEQKKIKPDT